MPIIRTRNIADQLSSLEQFIKQSEQAGAGLVSVVAGTVEGNPFNVVSFVFEPKSFAANFFTENQCGGRYGRNNEPRSRMSSRRQV